MFSENFIQNFRENSFFFIFLLLTVFLKKETQTWKKMDFLGGKMQKAQRLFEPKFLTSVLYYVFWKKEVNKTKEVKSINNENRVSIVGFFMW